MWLGLVVGALIQLRFGAASTSAGARSTWLWMERQSSEPPESMARLHLEGGYNHRLHLHRVGPGVWIRGRGLVRAVATLPRAPAIPTRCATGRIGEVAHGADSRVFPCLPLPIEGDSRVYGRLAEGDFPFLPIELTPVMFFPFWQPNPMAGAHV